MDWPEFPLSELTVEDTPITYGVVKPGPEDGILFVRGGDIVDGRILLDQLRTITREVSEQYRRTLLKGGEIVVSLVGNPGQVAIVPSSLAGANIARQVGLVRLRNDVDARFVKYFLGSTWGQAALGARSIGSVQQVINLRDLKTVRVPCPSIAEQRVIARILGALDGKIELNRRMCNTLEAIARAIFKSWFVDFDPVYAKKEGGDTFLPPHIAALFPDSLEDSEIGQIPSGWKVRDIYSLAKVIYGAPFSSKMFNELGQGMPLIRIRDLPTQNPRTFTTELHAKGYLVTPGDLVAGMDGEFRPYLWKGPQSWLNQRVCCFKPSGSISRAFVHYSIETLLAFFERAKVGTTVIHLGKADIDSFRVLEPPDPLMTQYSNVANILDQASLNRAKETHTLAALRHILLPKLFSGELRVTGGENFDG